MREPIRFHWGSILVGALICLLVQVAVVLLGSGVGLAVFPVEESSSPGAALTVGAIVALAVAFLVSFFAGGYFSTYRSAQPSRMSAALHGVATWAIATGIVLLGLGSTVGSAMGRLLANAGVIAGAAGGTDAVVRNLEKLQIVSDINLIQGKVITRIDAPRIQGGAVAAGVKEAKRTAEATKREIEKSPKTQAEMEQAAEDVRQVTAATSLAAFGMMIVALLGAILGAVAGCGPPAATAMERRTARAA